MNRSGYDLSYVMSPEVYTFWGAIQGNTTNPPTIPTTTMSTTSSIGPMTATNNFVASTGRSGAGLYTIVFKDSLPTILDISVNVWGTDGKWSQITDYNPSTKTLSVKVYPAGSGVAVDMATTDFMKITVVGQNSTNLGA